MNDGAKHLGYQRSDIIYGLFCLFATAGSIFLVLRDTSEVMPWLCVLMFALGLAVFIAAPWLRKYHADKALENAERVAVNNGIIERWHGSRLLEKVALDQLLAIHIATSDVGPWLDDICWVLIAQDDKGALLSNSAPGFNDVLDALQTLPGFGDEANQAIIDAMSCTDNQQFEVWKRR